MKSRKITDQMILATYASYKDSTQSLRQYAGSLGVSAATLHQRIRKLGLTTKARLQTGKNDLLSCSPALAQQFDPKKNREISLEDLAISSGLKIWWLCARSHSWQATPTERNKGGGCPVCSNKRVLAGYNDLATTHPQLALEWHKEKNRPLTAEQLTYGSEKPCWWQCAQGHEWRVTPNARTSSESGCPYCAGLKTMAGEGSLHKVRPDLMAFYNPTKNSRPFVDIPLQSNKKAWWTCPLGHEFEKTVVSMQKRQNPCDVCSGKRVLAGFNDVGTTHAHLKHEWSIRNTTTMESFTYGTNTTAWWKCRKGHEYKMSISNRATRNYGCPQCSKKASAMEGRLFTELLIYFSDTRWGHKVNGKEVDVLLPSLRLAIEVDGYPWHMNKQSSELKKDMALKSAGYRVLRIRDIRLPQYQGSCILVSDPSQSDVEKLRAINEVFSFISLYYPENIPNVKLSKFDNDERFLKEMANLSVADGKALVDVHPAAAMEWDTSKNGELTPMDVPVYSTTKAWWLCEKGHSYLLKIGGWSAGYRCTVCSGHTLLSGVNDAATKQPWLSDLFSDKNTIELSQVLPRKSDIYHWACTYGHEWSATVRQVIQTKGCDICTQEMHKSKTLKVLYPDIFRQINLELNPSINAELLTPKSHLKINWQCTFGHVYESTPYHRTARNQHCPICSGRKAHKGFNDLETKFPHIAKEWHPSLNNNLLPTQVTHGSGKMAWWLCPNGHSWAASVTTRTANNQSKQCTVCKPPIK